jgi:hypothetical protein
MNNSKILYHGSAVKFSAFDPKFYNSGEGVSKFPGWYFTDNMKGAYYHCTNYLRVNSGWVYECEIPQDFIVDNCEGYYTDGIYGCQAYGVLLKNSSKILINCVLSLEVLEPILWPN